MQPQRDEGMRYFRRPRLTCADCDSANKLLSPAAAPHHQSQVGLLDQLVHCALQTGTKTTAAKERGQVSEMPRDRCRSIGVVI